jgi:hypothetical protein
MNHQSAITAKAQMLTAAGNDLAEQLIQQLTPEEAISVVGVIINRMAAHLPPASIDYMIKSLRTLLDIVAQHIPTEH